MHPVGKAHAYRRVSGARLAEKGCPGKHCQGTAGLRVRPCPLPDLPSYLKPVNGSKADSFVPGGAQSCFLSHGDVDRTLVFQIQPVSMDPKEEARVVS